MSDFNRIAISGKLCSGKTTVAEMFTNMGYKRLYFANELKILCSDIAKYNKATAAMKDSFDVPPSIFMDAINSDLRRICLDEDEFLKAREQIELILVDFKNITYYDPKVDNKDSEVRRMLQQVGTEYMRYHVNDKIWVNAVEKSLGDFDHIVVDDLRYQNEFDMLRKNGFVMIRLEIPRELQLSRARKLYGMNFDESKLDHISETSLDGVNFDYIIDSSGEWKDTLHNLQFIMEK
jgi:dephospho-CoA kinase